MARNSIVIGTGSYHPEKYLGREYYVKKYTENINKFFDKTHINGKYVCAENESSLDLAVHASNNAIKSAGLTPDKIDLIILSTDTPAFLSPSTSVALQYKIKAVNAGTFDINCACAGFVTAMITAWNYIRNDEKINHVLVVGTYAMTKYIEDGDPFAEPLLGDGAGAIVLKAEESTDRGILATKLKAEGEYYDYLGIFGGGSANPPSHKMIDEKQQYVRFAKRFPATINEDTWPVMIQSVVDEAGYKIDDVNWSVLTQVNYDTIAEVHNRLNIPIEKAITIMDKYGYTGSACVPMAIHEAVSDGRFKTGDIVVMCASGGGANFASLLMKW